MRKWCILFCYIIIFTFGVINKDLILDWIKTSEASSLPMMFLLSALIASILIIPYTLFAGLMGAKYGVMIGLLINWFGGVSAAVLYFFLARYLFKDYFNQYLKKFKGIHSFQKMVEKNPFAAILFGRLIAIIPQPVFNIYSGASNIPFVSFFTATAIGILPYMFFISYSGEQIFSSLHNFSQGIIYYLIFIFFILFIYRVWFMRKSRFD